MGTIVIENFATQSLNTAYQNTSTILKDANTGNMWNWNGSAWERYFGVVQGNNGPEIHMGTNTASYLNVIAGTQSIVTFSSLNGTVCNKKITANNGLYALTANITTANITTVIAGCETVTGGTTDSQGGAVLLTKNVNRVTTGQFNSAIKLPDASVNGGMQVVINPSNYSYNYSLYTVSGSKMKLDNTVTIAAVANYFNVRTVWVSDGVEWVQLV